MNAPTTAPRARLSDLTAGWALDLSALLLLISPIYGCFFPAESYVSLPSNEGKSGYQALPIPVTTIEVVLIGLGALLFFWLAWRRGGFRHQIAAYLLVVIALASAAWAAEPVLTIQRALRFVPLILLAISMPQVYGVPRCLYLMTVAFLISAVMSIAVSVADPSLGVGRIGGAYDYAWRGAMVQKNLTGVIFAVGVYVSALAWLTKGCRLPLAATTAFLSLIVLVKSQSGTAVVALGAGMASTAVLMVIQRCPPKTRILLLIGALVGLIGLGLLGATVADLLFNAAGRDMTFTGRTPIWNATWKSIQMHPWRGYGYGFWTQESSARQNIWTELGLETGHSHNSWLDLWLQLGVFGLAAVVAVMWRSLASAMRLSVVNEHPAGPLFFGMMVLLLIRSMTEVQFTDPFPSIIFFPVWSIICATMLAAPPSRRTGGRRAPTPAQPMSRRGAALSGA